MSRTKTGLVTKKRHKKIIKFNSGYSASHSRLFKTANQEYMRSLVNAFSDRKKKKTNFRNLWIKQINNSIRKDSSTSRYSKVTQTLKNSKIAINRKILSKLSIIVISW